MDHSGAVAVLVTLLLWLEAAAPGTPSAAAADFLFAFIPASFRGRFDAGVTGTSVVHLALTGLYYAAAGRAVYRWSGEWLGVATGGWKRGWAWACASTHSEPVLPRTWDRVIPGVQGLGAGGPAPPPWALGPDVRNPRASASWALLVTRALEASHASAVGAFVRRLERRWYTLGVRLKASRQAQWFRAQFASPAVRRAWCPVAFRWWPTDRRRRSWDGDYFPDLETGPDPSPWHDWPNDRGLVYGRTPYPVHTRGDWPWRRPQGGDEWGHTWPTAGTERQWVGAQPEHEGWHIDPTLEVD